MKDLWGTRWGKILIVVGGGLFIGLFLFLWTSREYRALFWPALGSLLSMTVLWFGIDFAVRAAKRRREDSFDAGLAAKEGIEDRRREWSNWTAELKKQGIDRYELPFYLLVGEPQSGKSILLQNSDLHFPFGQTRLSGIGGTRGCDWWFTEEAVILDLAGRLFTHEGGASDEAEWQAFLDLLVEYRPMCPANGILLVIPCDRLIQDTPDKAAAKANRIQGALVTLTNKLQARVPVYVVLTKADKIFGFAEAVHRLEAQRRQEMFGWSRDAASFEAPFDGEEARRGFESLVERARALRAQMLATARVPDALAEVDRLYAFPDELAALQPTLAVYLQRIFAESSLVDRLYFRGLYLTSGLQTGAPIAKVCADLFKGSREADTRNLEALFTKQRAYFIKDLVRKRVFAERGLVRPTRGRVMRARRNAWVGYGVAAGIAAVGILGSIFYLFGKRSEQEENAYGTARVRVERLIETRDPGIPDVLGTLLKVKQAAEWDRSGFEDVFASSRSAFRTLYERVFDTRLAPKLRARAEETVASAPPPRDHPEFESRLDDVEFLLLDIDLDRGEDAERLVALIPEDDRVSTAESDVSSGKRETKVLTLEHAIALRVDYGTAPRLALPAASERSAALKKSIAGAQTLWNGVLERGSPWQVVNDLGYVLASAGLIEAHGRLSTGNLNERSVHDLCDKFAASQAALEQSTEVLDDEDGKKVVRRKVLEDQLETLEERRRAFLESVLGDESPEESWPRALEMQGMIDTLIGKAKPLQPNKGKGITEKGDVLQDLASGVPYAMPFKEVEDILKQGELIEVCKRSFLPLEVDDLGQLLDQLERGATLQEARGIASKVFHAKCRAVGVAYANRYQDERDLLPQLNPSDQTEREVVRATSEHLLALRTALLRLPQDARYDWLAHVDTLLRHCEERMLDAWSGVARDDEIGTTNRSEADRLRDEIGDLERYLRGMQVKLSDGTPSAGAEHVDWLARVDAHFAGRIADLEAQYRARWPRIPPDQRDGVLRVAQQIVDEHLERSRLRAAIDQARGGAMHMNPLKAEVFAALTASLAAFGSLERISQVPSMSGAVDDVKVVELRGLADPFVRDDKLAQNGPKMAGILHGVRTAKREPPKNGLEIYVADLRQALEEQLALEVRRELVEDLRQLTEERAALIDELFETPGYVALDEHARIAQLGLLFDNAGQLDALRESYRLAGVETPLDVWRSEQDLGSVEQAWQRTLEFLVALQSFLRGKDVEKMLNVRFDWTIEPDTRELGTLWKAPRSEGGKQAFEFPKDAKTERLEFESVSVDWSKRPIIVPWDFNVLPRKSVKLRWAKVGGAEDPGDAKIEIPGSLAPLLLAWRGKLEKDRYWLDATPENSRLRAPMWIGFKAAALPDRPDRPPR